MDIEILGAHSTEITNARLSALLIDKVLALDAGSLCSSLTLTAQQKLKAILLTHYHYDHVRDIPTLAMNLSHQRVLEVYSIPPVFEVLSSCLINGKIYPNFLEWPEQQPAVKFITITPYQSTLINGYNVLAIPVPHSVPTVGFQITSPQGKKLFYTGDTGVGLSACWKYVSPDLLITEVTLPKRMEEWALKTAHLTPQLLKSELLQFRQVKGYIPTTILIHINPPLENEIEGEVAEVAEELGASITLGREGLKIHL
jgi:ribonuclease BN (tRNA processing enzyme)